MKNYNEMPDMATINRYWGSLEAYKEEQRRTALLSLEEANQTTANKWSWDFGSRRNRRQNSKAA